MLFNINPYHYFNKSLYLKNNEINTILDFDNILLLKKNIFADFSIVMTIGNKVLYPLQSNDNISISNNDNNVEITIKDIEKLLFIQIQQEVSNIIFNINSDLDFIHNEITYGKHVDSNFTLNNNSNINYFNLIDGYLENNNVLDSNKKFVNLNKLNCFFMQNNSNKIIKNNVIISTYMNSNVNIDILNDIKENQFKDDSFEIIHEDKNSISNISYLSLNSGQAASQINSIINKNAIESSLTQHIKHILTSEKSKSMSKPSLIIHSPTVASHGNTIGSYPEDWLFYLAQRGIDKETSYKIIKNSYIENFCSKTPYKNIFINYFSKGLQYD